MTILRLRSNRSRNKSDANIVFKINCPGGEIVLQTGGIECGVLCKNGRIILIAAKAGIIHQRYTRHCRCRSSWRNQPRSTITNHSIGNADKLSTPTFNKYKR